MKVRSTRFARAAYLGEVGLKGLRERELGLEEVLEDEGDASAVDADAPVPVQRVQHLAH